MVQVVEQPSNVEEPSPFPGPIQSLRISKLHGTVAEVAHQVGSQIDPLNVVLLSLWWEEPEAIAYPSPWNNYHCILHTTGLLRISLW